MKILVSGAGIGGSAATLFLRASGHEVVTIDRVPAFNRRGYVLSLKYFGIGIMKSLGLFEVLQQFGIPYRLIQMRDATGALVQEYSERLTEQATKGSIFLLRPDLHQVLYAAVAKGAPVRFGTHIAGFVQNNGTAAVALSDGRTEQFDLVVIAEGLHSSSRALLWENQGFQPFDVIYAATLIDANHAIPFQEFQFYFVPGASLLFMPLNEKQVLLQCYFRGVLRGDNRRQQVRDLLRQHCRRFPRRLRDLLDHVADREDIFCDNVGLVSLPSLARHRVVVLGDAGYCPTFLSGMGASLALLGAKGLDQSLRRDPNDVPHALARYNAIMQPVIAHYQQNARANMAQMVSRSPFRTMLHNWILRLSPPTLLVKELSHQHDLETSLLQQFGDLEV